METLISAVFGALFLVVAYLLATQGFVFTAGDSSGSALGSRVIAPLLFGFFGVLLALGAMVGVRRLVQPALLEVGPDGLWAPALGRLAWSEVAEIRHETYTAPAGRRGGTVMVHRLGILPVEAARIHLSVPERGVQALSGAYLATMGRAAGLATHRLARFGILAAEFDAPFDEVLARVSEFFPVSEPPLSSR